MYRSVMFHTWGGEGDVRAPDTVVENYLRKRGVLAALIKMEYSYA